MTLRFRGYVGKYVKVVIRFLLEQQTAHAAQINQLNWHDKALLHL
jgi:hypothetical protein